MATEVFKLLGTIAIEASQAERTLSTTTTHAEQYSERMQNAFKKIASTAATVFSLKAIKDLGQACVEAYADLAAQESAFEQIMGDYADSAQLKLNKAAEATGVASSRMKEHFTMLTSRYLKHGYDIDKATDLAYQGMILAADGAALYNMSLDESMGHMNSFINGSYEGGEALGLFARDAEMAQRAVEQGFITDPKQWQNLKEGEKQLIRLNDIKRQFDEGKVTGQSFIEAGSYQNQLANMEAMKKEAATTLGKPLMEDVVLPVLTKLQELLQYVINNKDQISEALSPITEFLGDLATNTIDLVKVALEWIVGNKENLTGTINAISAAMLGLGLITHPYITILGTIVAKWDEITTAIDNAVVAVERFFGINNGSGVEQSSSGTYHGHGGGQFGIVDPFANSTPPENWDGTSGGFWGIPGAATGLDRVPYDNYLVRLHKDEAVLNATNASVWRNGGMGNLEAKMDSMLKLLGQLVGYNGQLVANSSRGQSISLDSRVLVGQLIPAIDVEMGNRVARRSRGVST